MKKRFSRRDFLKTAAVSSSALFLVACGQKIQLTEVPGETIAPTTAPTVAVPPINTPIPAGPKVVKVRLYGDIQNMDPAFRTAWNDEAVANCVFEGLVRHGPNSYDIVNQLAEKIETSEDGLTVTFKLKEGVKWQKGYGEVTTEDVKFSYERMIDPDVGSWYSGDWATLDRVEIIDKYNGKIIFKEPFAPLWKSTLPENSGNVICKKYVEEVGNEKFATNIIGSGPYIFDTWNPQQEIILKPNPDYHGDKPAWDEIRFIPIDDDKAAEVAIEAGDLDFSLISLNSLQRFTEIKELQTIKSPSSYYRWIGMNVQNPKLADINVRQAIRYAIDVPSILKATYQGLAEQEYALIPPGILGFWKDAPRYQRDVAKAKEFMAKANLSSLDLRWDIFDNTEFRTWAEIGQQNLKDIGINVTINPQPYSSMLTSGQGEKGKELELYADRFFMAPDPSWATMWFTCEQVGVWNWMRWCNAEYDALHKKGLVTMDDAEREKIYIQMQQIWDKDCTSIFITHGVATYAYKPTIKPAVTPHGVAQPSWFTPA